MATARLADHDRSRICTGFSMILGKVQNNRPFPIAEDDWEQWGQSLLPPVIMEKWLYLREHDPDLVRIAGGYHIGFNIETGGKKYYLYARQMHLPREGITVPETHPTHAAIATWASEQYVLEEQTREADRWLEHCISLCHSVGQIKRVLSEEIIRFVPNHFVQTLADAERQSRLPRDFTPDPEKHELLNNMLTLGSLSPEAPVGIKVSISSVLPIKEGT